jgi:YHS domain-containing protein
MEMQMKFLSLIILAIFAFLLMVYTQEKAAEPQQKAETVVEEAAADTLHITCSGCDMKMEKAKMISLEKDGKVYYFCSEECKNKYLSKKEGCEKVKKEEKK